MRIVHVVSGLAPDQRFGGISRVALDLAREQRRRGHSVRIIASDVGFDGAHPRAVEGVPVTLLRSVHPFPRLGFGTIVSPALPIVALPALARADLVHVHVAREVNTLVAARIAEFCGRPVVLQTHGMIDHPGNAIASAVDRVLTAPVVRRADAVLTLTAEEDAEVRTLSGGRVEPERFPNGVPLSGGVTGSAADRSSVLFLARLHPRKGARRFVEAADEVASEHTDLTFDLVGADEGDGPAVREAIARRDDGRITYRGPVPHEQVRGLMGAARLYVLPAPAEPFGLTVLEAMAEGTPVLLHESAVLAPEILRAGAGWTFGGPAGDLGRVLAAALADPAEIDRRGRAARVHVAGRYGVDAVIVRLDRVYDDARRSHASGAQGSDRAGSPLHRTRALIGAALSRLDPRRSP